MKLKTISIQEHTQLEPMLKADLAVLEEGLRVVASQLQTDSGPLDILAVDSDGTLIVVELKDEAAEGIIDQGLRYYDWCIQNLPWISRAYKEFNIDPKVAPRLYLVAPSFTDNVKRIAKYINIELKLFVYQAVENDLGEQALICNELDYGDVPEPPQVPTIDEKLAYITDDKVRDLFKTIINELKARGIEVRPVGGLNMTCWYKGKRFMWISPRKRWIVANVLSLGGTWLGRENITTQEAWDGVFNTQIKEYIDYMNKQ